jgi:hypothetical protein
MTVQVSNAVMSRYVVLLRFSGLTFLLISSFMIDCPRYNVI